MTLPDERTVDNAEKPRNERRNRDDEVMASAIAVMSQRGYGSTSFQDIAFRVGVLKGSLYHYFSSKEELLFRILRGSYEESDEIRAGVVGLGLPPFEELSEFLRRMTLWYLANVDRANIFFTEARQLTGERRAEIRERGLQLSRYFRDLIIAGQQAGEVRTDLSPVLLTEYVLGAINNVRHWPRQAGEGFSTEQMTTAFLKLTQEALRRR